VKSIKILRQGMCSLDYMIDRRLHVLRMVRQRGSVTAAAEALYLTPSAVSQQVRGLARDLDVELLRQEGRGVHLTPAAEVLLAHTDRLMADWERARAELEEHRRGQVARVGLCGFPSALAALLPDVVAQLRTDPELRVEVVQADPAECLDRLVAGTSDLAILEATRVVPSTVDERFEVQELFDDSLWLVVPLDHGWAGAAEARLEDAVGEGWVCGPPGGSYHQIELDACRRAGFEPRIVHRAVDWSAYLAIVRAGLGVALMPGLAIPADAAVARVRLADTPRQSRRVLTCVRRGSGHHPAIHRLREALERAYPRPPGG